ncbi:MAG TPA: S46 family peptidase [Saprospiraceae bacterium]|nr:S46 family peptidase [Saprospiraceae bacterium]
MQKLLLPLLFLLPAAAYGQGMWLPSMLEKNNEKDMKALGLRLDADDIYSPLQPSIKDAVCWFDGGCTGEIISPKGLILTNHHCGFDAIQSHSTLEHNYVDNGFWAKNNAEELPCPGMWIMFIVRMEDVTTLALQGVAEGMSERDRQSLIDKNLNQIKVGTKKEAWEDIMFKPMYNGNQYYMYVTVTYKDIRLVGAPPSSIGKFGSDTDNWVWPRHTGDFSLFRVYAGKDNRPADYSPDNQPYQPRHFLPVSLDGADEGDFTMVYGFPGTTNEYLPAIAVQQTAEVLDPAKVAIRDRALKIMDGFMRRDPAIKIAYIAKYASIANAWKKWLGEMEGLKKYKALDKKREYEAEFSRRVSLNTNWQYRYGNLLPRLEQNYREIEPYARARDYYLEIFVRNTELLSAVSSLNNWMKSYDEQGVSAFAAKLPDVKDGMSGFYKDYRPEVDQAVFTALVEMYAVNIRDDWGAGYIKSEAAKYGGYAGLSDYIYQNSALASEEKWNKLMSSDAKSMGETLKNDPAVVFWRGVTSAYQANVAPKLQEIQPQITMLQRMYMAAQLEVYKEKRFFPDANSTLRLTYGRVKDYSPRDAVEYEERTYLDGVMEKYVPGDYEFDVPQKLIMLWQKKDYGPYADADGRMPVAFIATNHTTGGNSGSPALDANGNLVGLNFDRVWEGTMSDLNYDPAICRNIMVDARYILFIIDKYGEAHWLIEEMKLVKGQKKKKKRDRD